MDADEVEERPTGAIADDEAEKVDAKTEDGALGGRAVTNLCDLLPYQSTHTIRVFVQSRTAAIRGCHRHYSGGKRFYRVTVNLLLDCACTKKKRRGTNPIIICELSDLQRIFCWCNL